MLSWAKGLWLFWFWKNVSTILLCPFQCNKTVNRTCKGPTLAVAQQFPQSFKYTQALVWNLFTGMSSPVGLEMATACCKSCKGLLKRNEVNYSNQPLLICVCFLKCVVLGRVSHTAAYRARFYWCPMAEFWFKAEQEVMLGPMSRRFANIFYPSSVWFHYSFSLLCH